MKKCPFCAEEIKDEAIKCKHCGSMLDATVQKTQKIKNPYIGKKKIIIGNVILLFGLLMAIPSCQLAMHYPERRNFAVFWFLIAFAGGILSSIGRFQNWYHWK